ncbi:N,N-dimethylformamidase beta subunit family domain-containing protein [Rhizohabitans arisaemae]|uniref:N,N-dimethylformamidase beta subunit family domain-containing protein n=1 Tax=Rhizohabitans arisaemae TaxID=2720610 RepID=UPI0024B0EB6F|nr:N,N-dimethylformamidase beta subunit family domain-containing protein [Rhizohabitans arisaemae]
MKLFGYLDRLSARPGDELPVMASGDGGEVVVDLVRLVHGDTNPPAPGLLTEPIAAVAEQRVVVDAQQTPTGSCLRAENVVPGGVAEVSVETLAWPTTPAIGREQGVLSLVDAAGSRVAALVLDDRGRPAVTGPDGTVLAVAPRPLGERRWYRLTAEIGPAGVLVRAEPLQPYPGDDELNLARSNNGLDLTGARDVIGAAVTCRKEPTRYRPAGVFNGKLERPVLRAAGETLAEWAFDRDFAAAVVADVSGRGRDAVLVNMPARAMTGHNWTGENDDFTSAPDQYGAIHFHDDDLIDAGWPVAATVVLPSDLRSGIYAVRLRGVTADGEETDHIPVVVRPAADAPRAKLAFLVPTFTYTAYANERLLHRLDYEAAGLADHPITPWPHDRALAEHPEFASSLYDTHSDGSGFCYSSILRPIPNLRPDYRMWLQNAPRHLGADLYLSYWLERQGFEYDVLSDHDLHADGDDALAGYQTVVTGSHPEYHSERMLDALRRHADTGGCLAYLGGNGFYWVTSQDPERPHVLEVRRSAGVRTWEARPGEERHSTTGERGGLWRRRGRSPNTLVGVGMCSQGWDRKAPPFERTPLSYEPEWSWVFDGIDDDLIGDFGFIMDGASGDELDRFDLTLGSPPNTAVLATSRRHSDYYQLAVEDVLMLGPGLGGSECEDVRSDMVVVEQSSGGAVFSVGSVCFSGSLLWNGADNNVSTLIRNVLANFGARDTKRS